jgi:hypothetical protein
MEVAGLIIGGITLASLFNTCLEEFKYIRIGLDVGKDYNKCLLQIAVAKRRFVRWGEVLGIGEERRSHSQSREPTAEEFHILVKLLNCIKAKFEDARLKSEKFESGRSTETLKTFDRRDLSTTNEECLAALEKQDLRTRKGTSLWNKTKWALYKKEDFDSLVKDLTKYIDSLEALFPSIEVKLHNAYAADIEAFRSDLLVVLKEAAEKTDKRLVEFANNKQQARAKVTIMVKDYAQFAKGDMIADSWKDVINLPKSDDKCANDIEITYAGDSKGMKGNMYGNEVVNSFWNSPTASERAYSVRKGTRNYSSGRDGY